LCLSIVVYTSSAVFIPGLQADCLVVSDRMHSKHTLRKASIVHAAQKMLTDRTAAHAIRPAAKRSSTIQIRDRNMPAARPAFA